MISWGSPYQFQGMILPLIPKLAEHFSVHCLLVDYRTPLPLRQALETMRAGGLVRDYWLLPDFSGTMKLSRLIRHHAAIRKHLNTWRGIGFDVLLAQDDFGSFQRYLSGEAVSEKCLHVCWIEGRTHLLIHKEMVESLLAGTEPKRAVQQNGKRRANGEAVGDRMKKILEEEGLRVFLKKGGVWCRRRFFARKKRWIARLDRRWIPLLSVGKHFPQGPYDEWTQTGSGDCDVMLFSDPVSAKAHTPLLRTSDVRMVRYPTEGLCRCGKGGAKNGAVLVGVGHGHELGEGYFKLYERDIRTLAGQTGASEIHLRPHPRSGGEGAFSLSGWLNGRGLKSVIVGNEKPVYEVACDYLAVAGPLSESLRDARATCDTIPVVGLIAVSDPRYADPRFSFGDHGMIGWIEKDGTYDPDIFSGRRIVRPERPSVPEMLARLCDETRRTGKA